MDIKIQIGDSSHFADCYDALMNSDIGREYFLEFDISDILMQGLINKEINVAIDNNNRCLGFIWYQNGGAFGMHTYLHMIAVKKEFRGLGIGKKLIADFESNTFKNDFMIFLLVASFNTQAKKLYENLGYKNVGIISGFYKKGVDEHLMMKEKI